MVLLGDEAQLKARFSPFGDSGNIDARWVHGLRRTFHRLRNHFGDKALVEARFGPFGYSANYDARLVHGLRRTYHRLGNHFGHTRWNS